MDNPENTPTTSSSPERIVSDVERTLSSVSLSVYPNQEPRKISDLPPEMILRVYMQLDGPSEITSLNKTSRVYYWIWRMNAASISGAVLQHIECYNSALELFEVEERIKQIHCIILPEFAVRKRLRIAQRQAREVVQQPRRNEHRDHISINTFYGGVLYRNERLVSAAKDASHLLELIEGRVIYSGGTAQDDFDRLAASSRNDIITAYHELVILRRLKLPKAMEDRLKSMCKQVVRNMLHVAKYLVCYCPDNDKIRLGVSRKVALQKIPWSWVIDGQDPEPRPKCQFILAARQTLYVHFRAVPSSSHLFTPPLSSNANRGVRIASRSHMQPKNPVLLIS